MLKLIDKVHRFNTGRKYSADGQPIVWAVVEDGGFRVVVFLDLARGIDGAIDLHFSNLDLLNDGWVLRAYDDYHYRSSFHYASFLRSAVRGERCERCGALKPVGQSCGCFDNDSQ